MVGRSTASIRERFVESGTSSFLNVRLQLARLEVPDGDRLERILQVATEISAEQLEVERVGIWFFDPAHTAMTQMMLYRASLRRHETAETTLSLASIPRYIEGIESKRVLVVEDVNSSEVTQELTEYLGSLGVSSLLDAPIFRRGQMMGVVCHEHVGPARAFTTREVDFAASVADMIALYLEEAEASSARQMLLAQEKELLVSERLASVGVVAGHVAHDLNNAVAPILLCAQQLKSMFPNDPAVRQRVDIILQAAEHGAGLARRLLHTATSATPVRDPLEIDSVLLDSRPLLRAITGDSVNLECSFASRGAMVVIDPLELIRAVINLLSNARDASVGRPSTVQLSTDLNTEGFVRLAVRDHGFGMSNEVQARLFQPFFTTKPGRGTGLGLAGVKRMVDAVRGTIRVETEPSAGTTVSLFFPRAAEDAGRSE